jgi:DNA repair exonuclease SbcCD ATPase subunit
MELPAGRYRRRFIVEFDPGESELVDRMGVAHRTKRAAILAGLRLLERDESAALRERVAALEAELATTAARLTTASAKVAETAPVLAQVRADLRAERAAHAETKRSLRDVKATMRETKATMTALIAERDRLTALVPHHAWCGSCGKLVPEAEWAETPARGGVDVYHKRDGYRPTAKLVNPATVLFWRETSSAPSASTEAPR